MKGIEVRVAESKNCRKSRWKRNLSVSLAFLALQIFDNKVHEGRFIGYRCNET